MGAHKGFRATQEPNGTWKAWAWDPKAGAYRKKSGFETEPRALAHAKAEHAAFITSQDNIRRNHPTRDLATRYETYLESTKKRSASHLKNVKRAMVGLCQACPDLTVADARERVEEWLAGLDVSAKTKVQYLVTVKALGNWATLRGFIRSNPWTLAETEEPGDPVKAQFTIDELRRMVAARRDSYWFDACTFIYTGMRASEPETVRREDIDLEGRVIVVTGKGRGERRKERLVPLQAEYLAILKPELRKRKTGPLAKVSRKQHRKRLAQFLRRLKIEKGARSVHSWRHGYAGLMTATGVPSNLLAAHMGHSSQATTATYSALATRYMQPTNGWKRGEFRLR